MNEQFNYGEELNKKRSVREANDSRFYWIAGHNGDVNNFYANLKGFIQGLDNRNGMYMLFDESDFVNTVQIDNRFDNLWNNKLGTLQKEHDKIFENENNLRIFIRDYIYLFRIDNIPLTLVDIENALYHSIYAFYRINYQDFLVNTSLEYFCTKLKESLIRTMYWYNKNVYRNIPNTFRRTDFFEKVVYYGTVSQNEFFFLHFIHKLGFDVLAIYSQGIICIRYDYLNMLTVLYEQGTYETTPIQTYKLTVQEKVSTIANMATEEISNVLFNAETRIFKPQQLYEHKYKPILLNTTYDETKMLTNQELRYRQGFRVTSDTVYGTQLFIKIDGVNVPVAEKIFTELQSYFENHKWIIYTYNFSSTRTIVEIIKSYQNGKNAALDYIDNLETNLGERIKRNISILKDLDNGYWNKSYLQERIAQYNIDLPRLINLITIQMLFNSQYEFLLKKMDFPFDNPKLITLQASIQEGRDFLNRLSSNIVILFSYLNGFDVIMIAPTKEAQMELFIHDDMYQKFILPDIAKNAVTDELNRRIIEELTNPQAKKDDGIFSKFFKKLFT